MAEPCVKYIILKWFGDSHHEDSEQEHRDAERAHHDAQHAHHDERRELDLLREQVRLAKQELEQLRIIAGELAPKRLSSIKVKLSLGGIIMPVGPLTIAAGKTFTASVVGFDQNGAPFSGPLPTPSFTVDNTAAATVDAASGAGVAVAAGVANVTGSLTSAEGLALSDTETVTVTAVVPVLSSIKVSLDAV